jgi:hypothetical protein
MPMNCLPIWQSGKWHQLVIGSQWISVIFKNANYYLNTNNYSFSETSGGQSSNLYLNEVHFLNTSVNKTSVAD